MIIARLIRSAAEPWMTVLIAVRSARFRDSAGRRLDPTDRPAPAQDRFHAARPLAPISRIRGDEPIDAGVFLEVRLDERGRLGLRNAQAARQAVGGEPVDHAEIDGLGDPALRLVDCRLVDAENPRGHGVVDVAVLGERPAQGRVVGVVGQDPQLDLRVIGRQKQPAGLARR